MSNVRIPDSPVPIEGYRAWCVTPDGQLRSLTGPGTWSAKRPTVAACSRGHRAPAFECTCGLYAMAGVEDLIEHVRDRMTQLVFGPYWSNVETDLAVAPRFWCYRSDGRVFRLAAVVEHPSDLEVEHEPSAVRPTGPGATRR